MTWIICCLLAFIVIITGIEIYIIHKVSKRINFKFIDDPELRKALQFEQFVNDVERNRGKKSVPKADPAKIEKAREIAKDKSMEKYKQCYFCEGEGVIYSNSHFKPGKVNFICPVCNGRKQIPK